MTLQTLKGYAGMLRLLDRLDERIALISAKGGDVTHEQEQRSELCRRIDEVECWISEIPDDVTRFIFLRRFADGGKWRDIASVLGGGNTEDSVKKRCQRYIKSHG